MSSPAKILSFGWLALWIGSATCAFGQERTCEQYSLALAEGRPSNAVTQSCEGVLVHRGGGETKPPPPLEHRVDPIDPEVRRLLREGSLPETSRLWLIVSAIQGTGCPDGRRMPIPLPSDFVPERVTFTIVGRIEKVGALLLEVDSADSTTRIVETVDSLRSADGRAVFVHDGQSWEIVSLELSSPVSRSLISSGLESSWTCASCNGDDIADGRRLLGSDPLKFGVRPTIRVGLLDSGVDPQSLSKTSIHARLDCRPSTGSPPSCDGLKPNDTNEQSHGTKSASILSGSGLGPYAGVTDLPLVSFKIGESMHQDEAVQRAVDVAVGGADHEVDVVLAQVQSTGHSRGVVAKLADYAFDHGLVVVAPVGNTGLSKRLTSPGNAHKALGVGAYRLGAPDQLLGGFGPTRDGRTKPDLLGPTDSEARARGIGQCGFHPQTSGAAPYVAGGVALLKNLVATTFFDRVEADDPGLIYPLALVAGQTPFDPCLSERRGAGAMVLPSSGRLFFGEVEITEGEDVWLPIPDVEDGSTIDAAIWWPESITQEHSDIDLRLRNGCFGPAGTEGRSYGSVFERVRALVQPGCAGKLWHLELSAYSVSDSCLKNEHLGRQRVYWAAYVGSKPESPLDP